MIERLSSLLVLLALSGCGEDPPVVEPRPEWAGAAIDGIAPLMTPDAVNAALERRGYRQVACVPERPVRSDRLWRGDDPACFEAPKRPMAVRLNFFDLKEGRRLAIVNFDERGAYDRPKRERLQSGLRMARRLRDHLGKPLTISRNPSFTTLYWGRPGGSPSLPDLISTTVSADLGATITMTSFWAYGQRVRQ